MGQIGSTPGILILRKGQDGTNRSPPLRKKADIFMPMKITRQSSAVLSGPAAASVWGRPSLWGELRSCRMVQPIDRCGYKSVTRRWQDLSSVYYSAWMQFDSGNIRWNHPQEPEIPIFGSGPAAEQRFVKRCKKPGATAP